VRNLTVPFWQVPQQASPVNTQQAQPAVPVDSMSLLLMLNAFLTPASVIAGVTFVNRDVSRIEQTTGVQVRALESSTKALENSTAVQVRALESSAKALQDSTAVQVKSLQDTSAAQVTAIYRVLDKLSQ